MRVRRIERNNQAEKRRVAAYCRVSTDKAAQEESYERQVAYYKVLIRNNPDWQLAGIYADHGCTGTSAKKRPDFQRLMHDALNGQIDLILVKSISRFSRNLVECDNFVKSLKAANVEVRFEKEGISSFDASAGFVFSLLAAVAQDESRSISENVRWRYANRFAEGNYNLGSNRIFGYDCVKGKLVPNENAPIVRRIFELFTSGASIAKIERKLADDGICGMRKGQPLTGNVIRGMLRNETYVGDKRLQKNPPLDFLTKRPDPNAKHVSYYLQDDHETIVDRQTWETAQVLLDRKQDEVSSGIYRHSEQRPLYGKLFCGVCGAPYTRRTFRECEERGGGQYKAWNCRERQRGRKGNGCRNRIVREEELLKEVGELVEQLEDVEWIWVDADGVRVAKR